MTKISPNGDIVKTRMVRHRDGTASIKRKVVGKASPPEAAPRQVLTPEQRQAREGQFLQRRTPPRRRTISAAPMTPATPLPEPKTKSAARNARKMAKVTVAPSPITAAPETFKERTHHEDSPTIDKHINVTTTNQVPKLLRRIKARTGSHVEAFQRDYEMVGSDLRSANLAGAGGSGSAGVPFPMAKVQAMDRLRDFERENMVAFRMCEAVLIRGHTPTSIHKAGGPEHQVCSHMIREAIEDLAGFYTPSKKRPDRILAVLDKLVIEAARWV